MFRCIALIINRKILRLQLLSAFGSWTMAFTEAPYAWRKEERVQGFLKTHRTEGILLLSAHVSCAQWKELVMSGRKLTDL